MKIKEKITNLVNTFIADPENAQKEYVKKTAHWNSYDIDTFWGLAIRNNQIAEVYETAKNFMNYLFENELIDPEANAEEFNDLYKDNGSFVDIGLATYCESCLTDNFYAEDIDEDEELYEKVDEAENLWYWHKLMHMAAQRTMYENDFVKEVANRL